MPRLPARELRERQGLRDRAVLLRPWYHRRLAVGDPAGLRLCDTRRRQAPLLSHGVGQPRLRDQRVRRREVPLVRLLALSVDLLLQSLHH